MICHRKGGEPNMARKSTMVEPKRRGRPATGKDLLVRVRLSPELIEQIDSWAKQEDAATRSDAIRRLVDESLGATDRPRATGARRGPARARDLAGQGGGRL